MIGKSGTRRSTADKVHAPLEARPVALSLGRTRFGGIYTCLLLGRRIFLEVEARPISTDHLSEHPLEILKASFLRYFFAKKILSETTKKL